MARAKQFVNDVEYKGYYILSTQGNMWTLEKIGATIEESESTEYPEFSTQKQAKDYIKTNL